jgi:hypothetical protein
VLSPTECNRLAGDHSVLSLTECDRSVGWHSEHNLGCRREVRRYRFLTLLSVHACTAVAAEAQGDRAAMRVSELPFHLSTVVRGQ